jgi:peptidoglycan/LPS O-acetylase OafA/YrhL
MYIDDARLKPEANNLTLVRLVLASAVIWTHSIWRTMGIEGWDQLKPLLGVPVSHVAVDGFFFLSGFLVYASLLRRGKVFTFAKARFLRLWPALAVSVLATVTIGSMLTSVPIAAYFSGATLGFLGNLTLIKSAYTLTGIQCGSELCNLNGSLWTIPWEVRCYAILALLGAVGLASRTIMVRFILPLTAIVALVWHVPGVEALVKAKLGNGIVYNIEMLDRLWTMFALGIAAYVFRDRIKLSWIACAALFALSFGARQFGIEAHLDSLFVGYATLCAGFLSAKTRAVSGTWPDYSYGMYIYAFPVMMALAALVSFPHHAWLALANFLVTLPLAALSWHFIEKPALDWGRKAKT